MDGGGVEGRLAGDGADAVGAEELLHLVRDLRELAAVRVPLARRARIGLAGLVPGPALR